MTMTMIERVARAIYDAQHRRAPFDRISASKRERLKAEARAALAETREPTAKMRAAVLARMDNPTVKSPKAAAWDALLGHYAMIDEALREE